MVTPASVVPIWVIVVSLLPAIGVAKPVRAAEPPVTALAFAPEGNRLWAGSQAGLTEYAWPALTPLTTVAGMPEAIHCLVFSATGQRLAIGGGTPAESGSTIVLQWPERTVRWNDTAHRDVVYAAAWSSDARRIATASLDGVCRILAATDGASLSRFAGHSAGLTGVAWVDDAHAITGSRDTTLRMWTADGGALVRTLNNHTGEVAAVSRSPAAGVHPLLASGGADRTLRFWQPTIGRLVRFVKLDNAQPLCLAWSADGQWIAAGTTAGTVAIIDPATAAVVRSLRASDGWVTAIAVSGDGRIAAGGSDGSIVALAID